MKTEKFLCILTLLFASRFSIAGDSALYAGIAVGSSSISFNSQDFSSPSPSNARNEGPTIEKDTGYKLLIGYHFDKTWDIEGGYTHHGKFQFRSTNLDRIDSVFDYSASSWYLAGKGTLPVTETIGVFGKLGLAVNTAKTNYWGDTSHALLLPLLPGTVISEPNLASYITPGSYSKISTAPLIGFGVEYAAWKDMKIRLEYENYGKFGGQTTTGRADIGTTSLVILHIF